jgi:hypothetical protein
MRPHPDAAIRAPLRPLVHSLLLISHSRELFARCQFPFDPLRIGVVPISRDVLDIQLDFFGVISRSNVSVSAVARNVVPSPVFDASAMPIVQSLNSLVYIPAPADFHNHVNTYIQRGSSSGWTFPVQYFLSASFLYSEVILIDIAIFNNHTQVYLKDYRSYTLPIFGDISIIDSDGNTLNALVCFRNLIVSSSVPSKVFAAWLQMSIVMCSEVTISSVSIIFRFSVVDEMDRMIIFTSRSAAFSVQSRVLQETLAGFELRCCASQRLNQARRGLHSCVQAAAAARVAGGRDIWDSISSDEDITVLCHLIAHADWPYGVNKRDEL